MVHMVLCKNTHRCPLGSFQPARRVRAPLNCHASTTANAVDVLSWAASQSASVDKVAVDVDLPTNRQVLVAKKDLATGEAVLTVPEPLWISADAVKKSSLGQYVGGLDTWLQLALFIVYESTNKGSKWSTYLSSITSVDDLPIFWSEEDLSHLVGTQMLQSLSSYRTFFDSQYDELNEALFMTNASTFPAHVFTREAFVRAAVAVRSRVHSPLEGDKLALVPVADQVAHRRGGRAVWKVKGGGLFGSGPALVVEAGEPIPRGQVISMDYGPDKPDNELLLDYGVLDSAKGQGGYSLSLGISSDAKYVDDKLDILEQAGIPGGSRTFNLRADRALPEDMLGLLRLMQLSGADCFLLESIFRNEAWGHMLEPVSAANEAAVCESMADGAGEALLSYPTTIDQDLALLRDGTLTPGSRMERAVRVRLGEKESLDAVLRYFTERKQNLDRLEYYAERRLRRLGLIDDDGRSTYDSFFKDGIA